MTAGFDFSRPGTAATRNVTYNADRMPVTINRGGVVTTLEYDGAGTRSRKIAGANTTVYVGDHYEVRNGVAVKYIFDGNLRIAKITGSTVTYFHKDHLGSSVLMTDAAGKPVSNTATSYKPFGEDRVYSALDTKDYKYTDQEYDSEAGLYNYNARMYDPAIGAFVSADIFVQDFSNPQALNRYAYCLNNPMIYVDPSGYWSLKRELQRVGKEIRRSLRKANAEIERFQERRNIRINSANVEGTVGFGDPPVGVINDRSPDGYDYLDTLFMNNEVRYATGPLYAQIAALGVYGEAYYIKGYGATPSITGQLAFDVQSDGSVPTYRVLSLHHPVGIGYGKAIGAGVVLTYSPFGNIDTLTGRSLTIGFTGGRLGSYGLTADFPLGKGAWHAIRNFSISISRGFGSGGAAFATISHTSSDKEMIEQSQRQLNN